MISQLLLDLKKFGVPFDDAIQFLMKYAKSEEERKEMRLLAQAIEIEVKDTPK